MHIVLSYTTIKICFDIAGTYLFILTRHIDWNSLVLRTPTMTLEYTPAQYISYNWLIFVLFTDITRFIYFCMYCILCIQVTCKTHEYRNNHVYVTAIHKLGHYITHTWVKVYI
jgi:hypothetical protein